MLKNKLLQDLKSIEAQIDSFTKQQLQTLDSLPETAELATAAWEADTHAGIVAIKNNLTLAAKNINKTLKKLDNGTYGLCEKCKKAIEQERLTVLPLAVTCIACI